MPVTSETTWTCDRSGTTVEVDADAPPPAGWRGVATFDPPTGDQPGVRRILCASCAAELQAFLEPAP